MLEFNYRDDGKPVTQQIWDNTAMLAAYQRANDLHGLLLPKIVSGDGWYLIPTFTLKVVENADIKILMDEINERIFFFLNESNCFLCCQ